MSSDDQYDVIVIGAGAVGENLADRTVQGGLRTLLVEHELVGGECSYWACMPSKALLRSAAALDAARAVDGATQAITGDRVDVAAVLARRDSFAAHWDDSGQVRWVEQAGIDLARGHARLDGARTVVITDAEGATRRVTARHAVAVCTGSGASIPPIEGLVEAEPWASREVTSAKEVPGSLAIIGGGVVAVEMATAYTALGCSVTVIARGRLLASLEDFAGDAVAQRLQESGARVLTHTGTTRVERDATGRVRMSLAGGDTIEADEVVVATGRTPRTADVGVDTLGLDHLTPGDALPVDDTMLVTGTDWLYAAGDATMRAPLTHQGKYQARAAGDAISARAAGRPIDDAPWGTHVATSDHRAVPQVCFSSPEVASVGLTADQAAEAGIPTRVVDYALGRVAGVSVHRDGAEGQARLVVDAERDVIVGFTVVGDEVAELLHAATVTIVGEVPIARLWHAVPAYPTASEVWLRLLEALGRPS
ncbi:dihydrolipoyl dehydrogenase family protein [Microcella alkaliphila]|jgi:dihydrolipoamide dehydrogenase|uniref:Pyridine nucleotide-disulfide oxidoreductase dimerization subunit n=1 Tax=Microcella alkaliphila TaxID=279828 RepID=A0A0U5BAC8_9MICO|nr:NAD(P)/FAD-dependent oxidoreductase [Microcella alkaliphila]BAU32724.1 pyridine nucleotide-disulfide oxidoreductase dimerization subunit [Microcella alkaliphila]